MKTTFRNLITYLLPLIPATLLQVASGQNLLTNPGFEMGTFSDRGDGFQILTPGSTVISGWTVINDSLAWGKYPNSAPNVHPVVPLEGLFFLDLQGDKLFNSPYGGVTQSIATVVGRKYALAFNLGTQEDVGSPATHGPVSLTASAGSTSSVFTFTASGEGSQWKEFKLNFEATSTSTQISLTGQSTSGGAYIGLDKVSVVEVTTPELSIDTASGQAELTVTGLVGAAYRLEYTDSLSPSAWTKLTDITLTVPSQTYPDPDPITAIGRRFYRLAYSIEGPSPD